MQVAQLLQVLQDGARGTQACINAAHTVSGIIGDLDTTIMFASAGTLNPEGDETFADHRYKQFVIGYFSNNVMQGLAIVLFWLVFC